MDEVSTFVNTGIDLKNFKKLTVSEKKDLLKEVIEKNITISFKFADSAVFKVKLMDSKKWSVLSAKKPPSLSGSYHQEMATVIMPVDQERYFFVSRVQVNSQAIHFGSEIEIYHLHRRSMRRTVVPSIYPAYFMIKKVHGSLSFLKGIVIDLSDQGMKIALNSEVPPLKTGFEILGTLRLGTRRGIEVKARIKHHKNFPNSAMKQIFGLEIEDMSEHSRSIYRNQLLDLQRDLFTIFMNKD